jgi:NTE family protein
MRRIAIGCQGGGSHTAFTTGALAEIIGDQLRYGDFEIAALSGTSGGAIGALLAWYGILVDGGHAAIERLDRFWREGFPKGGAARLIPDRLANTAYVSALRLPVSAGVSPYATRQVLESLPRLAREPLRPWLDAHEGLRTILEEYVNFASIPGLVQRDNGRHELLIGAIEVLSGRFVAFRGTDPAFGVEAVVASGTLPEIASATVIEGGRYAGVYWDGLYSQNPPIRDFFHLSEGVRDDKPDEIWLIRINPQTRAAEPRSLHDIADRRNELAGNLSLEQELAHVRFVNGLVDAFDDSRADFAAADGDTLRERFEQCPTAKLIKRCKPVALPEPIVMAPSVSDRLDYASKFDRDPAFLAMLIDHGKVQARTFLDRWRAAKA